MKPHLEREAKYIDGIIRGLPKTLAAIEAGFTATTARHSVSRIHNRPRVRSALQAARKDLREKAIYDTADAVAEIDDMILFARTKSNPMAAATLLTLKCRILGLIVDKMDVRISERPSVSEALDQARARTPRIVNPSLLPPIDPFEE